MKKEELVKELSGLLQHITNVMASLEKEIKPGLVPETAFQGIARKYFHAMWPHDGYLTRDWGSILNGDINKVRLARLKPVFNATLDLAMAAIDYKVVPLGSGGSLDKIHALKEPTP